MHLPGWDTVSDHNTARPHHCQTVNYRKWIAADASRARVACDRSDERRGAGPVRTTACGGWRGVDGSLVAVHSADAFLARPLGPKLNAFVRVIVVSRVECFGFRRSVRPIQTANRGCRVRRRRTKSVRLVVSFAKMPNRGLTNRMYPCETVATPSLTSPFF